MKKWLERVYSDRTAAFVSNPAPKLTETVMVRIRICESAPVRHVLLRSIPNGAEHLEEMYAVKREHGLAYYAAPLKISENQMQYQFYPVCGDVRQTKRIPPESVRHGLYRSVPEDNEKAVQNEI